MVMALAFALTMAVVKGGVSPHGRHFMLSDRGCMAFLAEALFLFITRRCFCFRFRRRRLRVRCLSVRLRRGVCHRGRRCIGESMSELPAG